MPELRFTRDHEWIRIDGAEARVGITEYAQKQLGDVVYLELPEIGRLVRKGDVFGTIESVKAVSDLFSPMSGEVTEVNTALAERPEGVNADPQGAWMVSLRLADPSEASDLLDDAQYGDLTR